MSIGGIGASSTAPVGDSPPAGGPQPSTAASAEASVVRGSAPRALIGVGATAPGGATEGVAARGYRFSERIVADVLGRYGLGDAQALIDAAIRLDDGNRYLKRSELEAAAKGLAGGQGYRWSEGVLDRTLSKFGLSERAAVLEAAAGFDEGGRYLNRSELEAGAEAVTVAYGHRWSERVLDDVLADHGLDNRWVLLEAAARRGDGNRYLNRSELEAAAKVLSGQAAELGIVSDIDKTLLPPHAGPDAPPPYPGVTSLLKALEYGGPGAREGDTHYVTARTPARLAGVPTWMEKHDLPAGTIDTGTSGVPWVAQAEKVRDISAIFDAHPDQSFVLLGDSSHRDPEVYREILARYPDRVDAVVIHKVNQTVSPNRVDGMFLVDNYADAAARLLKTGVLDAGAARAVMVSAQLEGLEITDAEIDRLIAENR